MNRRGQIQIQESIFIIFVFFIILVISLVVYFQFESRQIENIVKENEEDAFYFMLSYIPSMPELKCSELGYEDECVDILKLRAFSSVDKTNYHSSIGEKKIIFNINNEKINLYDYNPNNKIGQRKITSPFSIYDPLTHKYLIGVMEVYMYE